MQTKTPWRAISHLLRTFHMTKQQIAFELLVAAEIPALARPTSPTINHQKMCFDICILGLINGCSCSRGGKSHTGRFEGFCWRLGPWRKAASCESWHPTQVSSCCSPHVNLSIHSNHLSFLFNFANDDLKLCMCSVHLLDKKHYFELSIHFYGSSNLRLACQVHRESKRGHYWHLVKVWSADDAACDLLGLKTPRLHICSSRTEKVF